MSSQCPYCETLIVLRSGSPNAFFEVRDDLLERDWQEHTDVHCRRRLVEQRNELRQIQAILNGDGGQGSVAEALQEAKRLHAWRLLVPDTLRRIGNAIHHELNRGYVLTFEAGAGIAWRERWNATLADVETIMRTVERDECDCVQPWGTTLKVPLHRPDCHKATKGVGTPHPAEELMFCTCGIYPGQAIPYDHHTSWRHLSYCPHATSSSRRAPR
jgi:hypothetical protein